MEVEGSGFEIDNNWVGYNGRSRDEQLPGEPWSDGITLLSCDGGNVHDNTIDNNTDVDLVIGGGHNCSVQWNTIRHTPTVGIAVYGFAGIHVGYFDAGGGDNAGSIIANNTISSDQDKLGFGIVVGAHPWNPLLWTPNAGTVSGNSASGAVVPLAVDGIDTGSVTNNSAFDHRGVNGLNCALSADYTAGDWGARLFRVDG